MEVSFGGTGGAFVTHTFRELAGTGVSAAWDVKWKTLFVEVAGLGAKGDLGRTVGST